MSMQSLSVRLGVQCLRGVTLGKFLMAAAEVISLSSCRLIMKRGRVSPSSSRQSAAGTLIHPLCLSVQCPTLLINSTSYPPHLLVLYCPPRSRLRRDEGQTKFKSLLSMPVVTTRYRDFKGFYVLFGKYISFNQVEYGRETYLSPERGRKGSL